LPQRIKSDVIDGAISFSLMLVPLYVFYGGADYLPPYFHRLSIAGIPAAILYVIFRDSIAKGTSLGKRALGLVIVDLKTGLPCNGTRVLARNVIDIVPIIDLLDLVLTCVDKRGQKIMDKVLSTQVTERAILAEEKSKG